MRTLKTANGPKEVILNVQPQAKDVRDEKYRLKIPRGSLRTVPSAVDNRNICSPIRDQGNLGSCTAFSVSALVESAYNQTAQQWLPSWLRAFFKTGQNKISTLFQYYASRVVENTVNEDSGATIRGSVKAVANFGAVGESKWPYQISKFRTNPPGSVWAEAKQRKARSYHPIADGDLETMKALLSEGKLITFGFTVYDYMLSQDMAVHGLLTRPSAGEQIQGGHAVALVGYDDNKEMPDGSTGAFLVRNSWGADWGLNGYFWMAYDYVGDPDLSWDFWTIQPFSV